MKNRSIWIKFIVCFFPIIAYILIYIFRDNLIRLGGILPACPSYTFFDIYCPGCGNTRSIQHLLAGDIVGSLRFNPSPIFAIIIATIGYIELIAFIFGKNIKLVPRSRKFWMITILVFSLYFIIRNYVQLF